MVPQYSAAGLFSDFVTDNYLNLGIMEHVVSEISCLDVVDIEFDNWCEG